ncbi:hypothetical protein CPB84DRAFT_751324 [Gymnopilus junonius]|uniref:Uncharacterized protein n=1 Tax=Gymnopilus junonius TaxID=109634 RepID=A0A9P5NXN4_GYMJU|nr:hypothetical protein CPB84DRAFT_751324 [Gymnopilus junonius]
MLASLLSPTSSSTPQPRISQLLPTVKCSTCHQPVPVNELGDHTCEGPPPAVPSLPKPSISPEEATSLLPGRLQGRVASPAPPKDHQRLPSSASARLRINTKDSQSAFQPKPSPLARSESSDRSRDGVPFPSSASPLRTRPPPPGDPMRMRTPSNAGSISNQNTPLTARPTVSFSNQNQDATTPVQQSGYRKPSFSNGPRGPPLSSGPPMRNGTPQPMNNNFAPPRSGPSPAPSSGYSGQPYPPARPPTSMSMSGPRAMGPPPPGPGRSPAPPPARPPPGMDLPPNEEFVPPAERGIDTKSGGAAGMAGVGRRGFAAAARAAMFVAPIGVSQQHQQNMSIAHPMYGNPSPNGRRPPNAPKFLDIDAATRSTETPPLSAGSGYSSHSPGPTSPLPQSEFAPQTFPTMSNLNSNTKLPMREPSPASFRNVTPIPAASNVPPASPRLPFFEKLKESITGSSASDVARARADSSASRREREKVVEQPRYRLSTRNQSTAGWHMPTPMLRITKITTTTSGLADVVGVTAEAESVDPGPGAQVGVVQEEEGARADDRGVGRRRLRCPLPS